MPHPSPRFSTEGGLEIEKTDSTTVKTIAEPYFLASVNFYRTAIFANNNFLASLNVEAWCGILNAATAEVVDGAIGIIVGFVDGNALNVEGACITKAEAIYLCSSVCNSHLQICLAWLCRNL